jgi:hypothetical protein
MASPLAPVLSSSGLPIGSVSALPSGEPDPLLASVLCSYFERLSAEERYWQAVRSGLLPPPPPSSGSLSISDRH